MRTNRRRLPAVLTSLMFVALSGIPAASASAAASRGITEFALPTTAGEPMSIAPGPDGNLWLTEYQGSQIVRITPSGTATAFAVDVPGEPVVLNGITPGPDGAMWFTVTGFEANSMPDWIGRITMDGSVTLFPLARTLANPVGITAGPDGNLWFTEYQANRIGRITPGGVVKEFRTSRLAHPWGIVTGADGNLWFAESGGGSIGRITPTGKITEYPTPTNPSVPRGVTLGADGNVWFTEDIFGRNAIGRITPSGDISEFPLPTSNGGPQFVSAGPDGNIWFTETAFSKVGQITPAGTIREWRTPTPHALPEGITQGADGHLWFAESETATPKDQVGRITL